MRYFETTFYEYLEENKIYNLHKNYENLIQKLPDTLQNLNNLIIYGPSGIGKYTQALKIISKYSNSELQYEKKIQIQFQNKHIHIFKISDIHYEIDFELLGCNARLLWNDIYTQIRDIITNKEKKQGIIVCKNFHYINSELLETFYNFMQNDLHNYITIKFIIISENISFIPSNILNMCNILHFERPSRMKYNKCLSLYNDKCNRLRKELENTKNKNIIYNDNTINNINKKIYKNSFNTYSIQNTTVSPNVKKHNTNIEIEKLDKNYDLTKIQNIKDLKSNSKVFENKYELIINKLIEIIGDYKSLDFIELRENLYKILIYHLDTHECMYYIIKKFIEKYKLSNKDILEMNIKIYEILKYYNNNYRPITHLENFSIYLCNILQKYNY